MKKQLLLLVMMLLPMVACADNFLEEDLAGKWVLESAEGEFTFKLLGKYDTACPTYIIFKLDRTDWPDYMTLGSAKYSNNISADIFDYFLTYTPNGGQRLHIYYKCKASGQNLETTVRYIVNYIDKNRMELQTYDKRGKVVYVRQNDQSSVRSIEIDNKRAQQRYSLKGERISTVVPNDVFIQDGKKYANRNRYNWN